MRLPCEPLTRTTSPGLSRAATSFGRLGRGRGMAAAAPCRQRLVERAHLGAGGEDQVDVRVVQGPGQLGVEPRRLRRPAPACRPARRCAAAVLGAHRREHRDRRAHRGRAGVVAFVDQHGLAARRGDLEAPSAPGHGASVAIADAAATASPPAAGDRRQHGEAVHRPMAAGRADEDSRHAAHHRNGHGADAHAVQVAFDQPDRARPPCAPKATMCDTPAGMRRARPGARNGDCRGSARRRRVRPGRRRFRPCRRRSPRPRRRTPDASPRWW